MSSGDAGGEPRRELKPEPLRGFTITIPVRFAECDSYAVVWHGHYALYLEQVREAFTSRFGFTATKALSIGYRVPITRMEIRYRKPVVADTEIRVSARLRAPEVARLVVDYEIRDAAGDLLANAVTEQVVVNRQGELLLRLPPDLQALVSRMLAFQDASQP
ncbi:MAG: acyl-CoA thioesterase [Acidobacteriota bacterium]|nr:acyl-CoA thioesterase [Acidobacteriota bacterium]